MSYKRILETTLIMGGSSVVNTILGILRTKVLALMLGPSGIGLAGIYTTVTSLLSTVCGMGIGESGVRQIAGAVGSNDDEAVARTIITIRRSALISGVVGCVVLFIFCGTVSRFTFGTRGHTFDLALLSLTILFGAVSSGQTALIQGVRRIGDLAKLSMIGALLGTVFSIPIIYAFGQRGVAYFLLAVSATSILTSWWYARKVSTKKVTMTWRESMTEAKPLLKLGSALMCGTLMIACTQYFLRVFIVRNLGLDAAGIYQASTTLSLIYVGVILNAMLTDFYPRLSEASHDNAECASLINKQIEVGLLLAVPGILAIMTCAPFVIAVFYSSKFLLAVDILRWQILGVMLQVVAWPIGFILRAKGNGKLFFETELFANATHLGFAWIGVTTFGLPGAGAAFFVMNLCYFGLIFLIARSNYAFSFTGESVRLLCIFSVALGVVFATPFFLPKIVNLVFNIAVTILVGLYALKILISRAGEEMAPGFLLKIKSALTF
ncbi:O-antigen translocase [Geomonas sp. RF6]|uniref:O-antigen translocase n=1 Tax=Geomonas sp. RF6 TaxID=2897342 RepID=UPI001E633017|nr:O-antigen translocase [Geomonas sp. RF6]UFS71082.1 O-antigen translocase [Geomonas sp. RF6]